jgi:hypothetical protein
MTFAVRRNLCRALYFGRTTKSLFADKGLVCRALGKKRRTKILFAVRFIHRARQSIFLPYHTPTETKYWFFENTLPCALPWRTTKTLVCPAFSFMRTVKYFFYLHVLLLKSQMYCSKINSLNLEIFFYTIHTTCDACWHFLTQLPKNRSRIHSKQWRKKCLVGTR